MHSFGETKFELEGNFLPATLDCVFKKYGKINYEKCKKKTLLVKVHVSRTLDDILYVLPRDAGQNSRF